MTSQDPTTTRVAPRASKGGLAVAAVGIVILNVAPFLPWVSRPDAPEGRNRINISGYETDSLVPFMAYLGLGILIALVYAAARSDRGQHRGLTLASMAIGIAVTIQCLAFALDPMGDLERGFDLQTQYGVWVGLLGALLWAIGSGLLAKEPEGDDYTDTQQTVVTPPATRRPAV
jgi:ABC-type Fe3+-siderophore transport system permease subunit